MANLLYDSEEQRFVDSIRCITYREIRDEMIAKSLKIGNGSQILLTIVLQKIL
jgi:hypothetical protein